MSVLWILVGILVLSVMVLVHEWGHFVVARLLAVRVDIFSIGFGPRLFGLRRGPTDYRVSALPLGGYVKMAGDNPVEERSGAGDEFLSKPRWARALIAVAGPATNILFAVVLLAALYMLHYERPAFMDEPARLEGVVAGSPAEQAGLQRGDLIVRVNQMENPTWEQLQVQTLLSGRQALSVEITRSGESFERSITPDARGRDEIPFIGWYPYDPILVTSVEAGMPGARAGLQPGDKILVVEGTSASEIGGGGLFRRLQESEGAPVELVVRREQQEMRVTVAAEKRTWQGRTGYFLGIGLGPVTDVVRLHPAEAVKASVDRNLFHASILFALLGRLVGGHVSVRNLAGPIGITVMSGQAAQLGWSTLFDLMALISINLAVLNLFPIPILDGGHIAVLALEGLRKRDFSIVFKERIAQAGLFVLLLLFVVVMYNDIARYLFN